MPATPQSGLLSTHSIAMAQGALAEGYSLPYEFIGNPEVHAFEQTAIFNSAWQVICPQASTAKPGTVVVSQLGSIPIVIVRGEDDKLRGFVNFCRHRGYPVAPADSCSKLLTCKYHGWTYDLTGALIQTPEANTEELSTFGALALKPVSVAIWRGCVFANPDPDAPDFGDYFQGVEQFAAECGFDLSHYNMLRRFELDIAADWKLVYDNSVECYHCPSMHARTLNTLYDADGFADANWAGRVRKVMARLKGSDQLHHSIQLFPGSYLVMDPVIGIIGRFYPVAPDRTKLVFHFLAAPGATTSDSERYADLWSETLQEDHAIVTAQQNSVSSGMLEHGYLVSGPEASVHGVQRLILDAYRQAIDKQTPQSGGETNATVT